MTTEQRTLDNLPELPALEVGRWTAEQKRIVALYTHAAVEKATAELRRDAERYRALRYSHECGDPGDDKQPGLCVFDHGAAFCLEPVGSMPGELDAAIDAAIASTGGTNV